MNKIDYDTTPAGFPLESDAILGQMQTNIYDALTALGGMALTLASGEGIVLTGCVESGSSMSDGWILLNNGGVKELFFFEGGAKQTTFIIDETAVAKSNQDGTSIDRIYTRKLTFGTGSGSFLYQNLYRYGTLGQAFQALEGLAKAGTASSFTGWVVLWGLNAVSGGSGGISAGAAIYNGRFVEAAAYSSAVSSGSPRYLKPDGSWTGTSTGIELAFNPYTDKHLRTFYRKGLHPVGSLLPMKSTATELSTFFDGTGLGSSEWNGWAIANGNNSTLNLSSAISGVSWIQRMS